MTERIGISEENMTATLSHLAPIAGFFILFGWPRTQILEYDPEGRLVNEYYYEDKNYETLFSDFIIQENGEEKIFYLLKRAPEKKIVIFRPKNISSD